MNLKFIILLFIFCIFFYTSLNAQSKSAEIDKLVQKYNEIGQFNGTVLVAESGKIILKKGYGFANLEWNIPNKANTKFDIGSVTKQFTAMLIMQLVEQGKIKLDAKIIEYLPDYRQDTGDKITIHHLLTHTSGIPDYSSLPDFFKDVCNCSYNSDEFIKKFCSNDLEFEPGTNFSYGNSGYYILGAIIEAVTNESYETVLQRNILDPLNMKNTGMDRHELVIPQKASGYENTLNGYINSDYFDMVNTYAAGALYSTVDDLFYWDQTLYTEKLLSNKYKDLMFKPYKENYAYGWLVDKISIGHSANSLKNIVQHGGGGVNGIHTLLTRLIDDRHLIILLHNTGGTSLKQLNMGIINILYNQPYKLPKKSIAREIYKVILDDGIIPALKYYQDKKNSDYNSYYFYWDELDWLGKQLIEFKMIEEGIAILKFNTSEYPDSWFVFDTLAEAYLINNQVDLAKKIFKKSLELNPNNTNAIERLNSIK